MQHPAPHATDRPANHLAGQTSPYLLQHVHNPVDWYPWDDEALQRAKAEGKPIFLSIGYSACHWCHVMEHESFENEEVAAYLNQHFISIKVDREERPDLDDLYMAAVQRMTGAGGWPMTVFLTPDLKPFFGGTYFPLESKYGRPGFKDLLHNIQDAWMNRRADVVASAEQLTGMLEVEFPAADTSPLPNADAVAELHRQWLPEFAGKFDSAWGGFGGAPKFPPAGTLLWLLQAGSQPANEAGPSAEKKQQAIQMASVTLQKMAAGGMYDQIGGGFARYSVDAQWLIPHFEKMLYDQGTLIPAYLEAWRVTGDAFYGRIASECCDYLLKERIDPAGGIWSATDADSEGEEGKFFAWTSAQLTEVLGEERGKFAAALFSVSDIATFEHGTSVLQGVRTPTEVAQQLNWSFAEAEDPSSESGKTPRNADELAQQIRNELYQARSKRVPPGNDDKVLTAWNGLAIHALAWAGAMFQQARYTDAATRAADFIWGEMWQPAVGEDSDGEMQAASLKRSWRKGKAQHRAVLEDYSYLTRAMLSLFQTTGDEKWLHRAELLGSQMLSNFWDEETAIFWDTDGTDPTVLHRLKSPWDGAIPSANAIALESLLGLHAFTLDEKWRQPAHRGLAAMLPFAKRGPSGFSYTLRLYAMATDEPSVALVVGDGTAESLTAWRHALLNHPQRRADWFVFRHTAAPDSERSVFQSRTAVDGKATLYLCSGATCEAPKTDPNQ